jgi:hypothetical protein
MIGEFEDVQKNLRTLIALMYGLAIATGIEHAIDYYFASDHNSNVMISCFTIVAIQLGISDWLLFYGGEGKKTYKNITRLTLDIAFPLLIYLLFSSIRHKANYLSLSFFYFLGTWLYFPFAHRDGIDFIPFVKIVTKIFSIISGLMFITVNWLPLFLPKWYLYLEVFIGSTWIFSALLQTQSDIKKWNQSVAKPENRENESS